LWLQAYAAGESGELVKTGDRPAQAIHRFPAKSRCNLLDRSIYFLTLVVAGGVEGQPGPRDETDA
jgi:hypothetical protein